MIHIKVPATSANMGPGFDCAGIALNLYNEIWVDINDKDYTEIISKDNKPIPKDDRNLILSTIKGFYEREGIEMPPLKLIQKDEIPMTRGLGSSAACIVAGLMAANELSGKGYTKEELAAFAAELEGHPDNSNPALLGGMIISVMHETGMNYVKIDVPKELVFAVMIPDFALSTTQARRVLPKKYSRSQAVFNSSRTGLLVASMMSGQTDNLRVAMDDSVHQPFRKNLIRGYDEIFEAAKEAGSKAEYLSGAGPTLMAVLTEDVKDEFERNLKRVFSKLPDTWNIKYLEIDTDGATVEIL